MVNSWRQGPKPEAIQPTGSSRHYSPAGLSSLQDPGPSASHPSKQGPMGVPTQTLCPFNQSLHPHEGSLLWIQPLCLRPASPPHCSAPGRSDSFTGQQMPLNSPPGQSHHVPRAAGLSPAPGTPAEPQRRSAYHCGQSQYWRGGGHKGRLAAGEGLPYHHRVSLNSHR